MTDPIATPETPRWPAGHPDARVLDAAAAFEAADDIAAEAALRAVEFEGEDAERAAIEAEERRAAEERDYRLRELAAEAPKTMAGHAARARLAFRVAGRFFGGGVEPVHLIDAPLLTAILRDLVLADGMAPPPAAA